jgi:hypothetical protein
MVGGVHRGQRSRERQRHVQQRDQVAPGREQRGVADVGDDDRSPRPQPGRRRSRYLPFAPRPACVSNFGRRIAGSEDIGLSRLPSVTTRVAPSCTNYHAATPGRARRAVEFSVPLRLAPT